LGVPLLGVSLSWTPSPLFEQASEFPHGEVRPFLHKSAPRNLL
jgi:hypothetical protein